MSVPTTRILRAFLPLLAIVSALLVDADPAAAWGREAYTVSDMEVVRTAHDAVSAKRQALDHVYTHALSVLFRRLARESDLVRLPAPSRPLAERLMDSFKVASEEAGATRYAIQASMSFDPVRVGELFHRSGVRVHDRPGPLALIVPVHVTAQGVRLYGDSPRWNDALAEAVRTPWLVELKLAPGSRQDRLEPAERLRALDRVSLDYLRVRHSAQGALIAEFTDATGSGPAVFRLAGDSGAGRFEETLLIAPDIDDPFAYAAARVPLMLDAHWKEVQSHGSSAGLLINGVQVDPLVPDGEEGFTMQPVAQAGAALSELRLTSARTDDTARGKPRTQKVRVPDAPVQDATPQVTGAIAGPSAAGPETITVEIADGPARLELMRMLSRIRPLSAFEVRGDGTDMQVVLWYHGDRETLFRALSDSGLPVRKNLASNNWRIVTQ